MEDNVFDLIDWSSNDIQEDFEPTDYSIPINCGGKAKITEIIRDTGTTNNQEIKNIFKIKMVMDSVLPETDEKTTKAAKNRHLDVTYFVSPNKFQTPNEVVDEIKKDLNTIGCPLVKPKTQLDENQLYDYITVHLNSLKDKIVDVRCYPGKKKPGGRIPQKTKIVKRDVTAKKKEKTNVPF